MAVVVLGSSFVIAKSSSITSKQFSMTQKMCYYVTNVVRCKCWICKSDFTPLSSLGAHCKLLDDVKYSSTFKRNCTSPPFWWCLWSGCISGGLRMSCTWPWHCFMTPNVRVFGMDRGTRCACAWMYSVCVLTSDFSRFLWPVLFSLISHFVRAHQIFSFFVIVMSAALLVNRRHTEYWGEAFGIYVHVNICHALKRESLTKSPMWNKHQ